RSADMAAILSALEGKRFSPKGATTYLRNLTVPELSKDDRPAGRGGRGWGWAGPRCKGFGAPAQQMKPPPGRGPPAGRGNTLGLSHDVTLVTHHPLCTLRAEKKNTRVGRGV